MSRETPKELLLMLAALDYADGIAKAATCDRAKYGCVLTTLDLTPVSFGYNGVASGLPNECFRPDEPGNCACIHAEHNAIANLRNTSYNGPLIAFITGEPCEACAMMLARVGTAMVVYVRPAHRSYGGTELLDRLEIPHGHPSFMAHHLIAAKKAAKRGEATIEEALRCTLPYLAHQQVHCPGCGEKCGGRCVH